MTTDQAIQKPARRPQRRARYTSMAEKYNALPPGGKMRIAKVPNITHFKRALDRRGVTEGVDYEATQDKVHCYVKRLTDTPIAQ